MTCGPVGGCGRIRGMDSVTEKNAAGAPREPVKHRMTQRLSGWDYRQRAIFMITITLKEIGKAV